MMKPIYEFQTIQVELTNACVHECSNCTRFCGHHKKNFFMDWDTFKKAIDSLENWPRCIGIMGGEPTLHPEFERFVKYASEKHPMQYDIGGGHKPISSLSKYIYDANSVKAGALNKYRGLGLWSSVCNKYYEHYEVIQDKFAFQCINDHTASSRHQAWLMTRKEFGITDDEWIKIRDNCWWQRLLGSPSITPKGAFFCEVAAAMDMLFDGPGGWKIEKDWWKRGPEDYKDQLKWCEFCSGAFHSFDRDANESVDDVSPVMYEKLKEVGSPKLNRPGAICVHKVGKESDIEIKPRKNLLVYQPNHDLRFTDKNKCLYARNIFAVCIIDDINEIDTEVLEANSKLFDTFVIFTSNDDVEKKLQDKFKIEKYELNRQANQFARIIRKADDWVALIEPTRKIETDLREKINKTIFNPGTMHIFDDTNMLFFNVRANSYKTIGFDGISALEKISELPTLWVPEKVAIISEGFEKVTQPDIEEWIETITKKGIMNWNFMKPKITNILINRVLLPKLEEIFSSKSSMNDKLKLLDEIEFIDAAKEEICSRVKKYIHNEIAKSFSSLNCEQIKQELLKIPDSFSANYALAMLSVGKEKKTYLIKAITNKKNFYNLGLATLKAELEAYSRKTPKYELQKFGVIEEVVNAAMDKGNVLLVGNEYSSNRIEEILTNAGLKPVCFVDNDKQGLGFDGLNTINFTEALTNYPTEEYMIAKENADESIIILESKDKEYITLHPLTLRELDTTPCNSCIGISDEMIGLLSKYSEDKVEDILFKNIVV